MALSYIAKGTKSWSTNITSISHTISGSTTSSSMFVVFATFYNSGLNGASTFSSITDSIGNTWSIRVNQLYDPGAANAGFVTIIGTTNQDVGLLNSGTTINVNFTNNVSRGTVIYTEVGASVGNATYKSVDLTSGVAGNITYTTPSLLNGEMTYVFASRMDNPNNTYDSDTTCGSWSTAVIVTSVRQSAIQTKVVTCDGTQTWNLTSGITSPFSIWGSMTVQEVVSNKPRNYYYFLE